MKKLIKYTGASAIVAFVGVALAAPTANESSLLLIGPVNALIPNEQAAIVLGQRISLNNSQQLTVGETAAVFGKLSANGVITASEIRHQGPYVAGSTTVFLTGIVQKNQASIGHAQVGGLSVDLTPAMASGPVTADLGSIVQIVGTQPAADGVVLANGISGSGSATASGISGSGLITNGISGSDHVVTSGISGSGLTFNGISGSGHATTSGISGSGLTFNGISGSGHATTNGISGSGLTFKGISGSGQATTNGISGSGLTFNGISGSGHATADGISGSGLTFNGISGSGHATTIGKRGSGRTFKGFSGCVKYTEVGV